MASRNVSCFLMLTKIQDGHLVSAPAVSVLGKDDYKIFSLWYYVIQRFFQKQQFSNLYVKPDKFLYNCLTIVINRLSRIFLSWQMGEYHSSRTQGWLIQWRVMVDITLFIFNWHMRCYLTVVHMATGYLLFLYRITIPAVSGWTFDRVSKLSL